MRSKIFGASKEVIPDSEVPRIYVAYTEEHSPSTYPIVRTQWIVYFTE